MTRIDHAAVTRILGEGWDRFVSQQPFTDQQNSEETSDFIDTLAESRNNNS